MPNPIHPISAYIRTVRASRGESLQVFAGELNKKVPHDVAVSHQTIYRWEQHTRPRVNILLEYARAYPPTTWQGEFARTLLNLLDPLKFPPPGSRPDKFWK